MHVFHTCSDTCLNPSSFQLFDLVYREETLLNVIKSVTRNGRSIVLTAVLALILVYLFSIVGYIFFKDDFILAVDRIPNKTLGRYFFILINTNYVSDGEQSSVRTVSKYSTLINVSRRFYLQSYLA